MVFLNYYFFNICFKALILLIIYRQLTAERYITMAAKLIAPVIEDSFDEGFDW